ncbi:hypothetical protein ACFFX1_03830 [Dactylosporangium sucinum]|uniref:Actin-binding WH2 domain-containing protein n=1 Tax=Dactylosporangium sucinum TaxID=1424081 RepID=A0A917TAC3_9ACTN|nr:hypothetical protein [Dactylosporangium sucinum]GGM15485.1 hypothetical protein GCM10007977_015780 [Dactylosporangium sucinum]
MATHGEAGSGLLIIERILRDRDSIWRQIGEERDLGRLTRQMLYSSVVALACYGAVLGASNSVLQAGVSAVKLPLLFLTTLAICLPTLYLFNLVFGARLQVRQALALVMVTITVTSVLTLAFAPISLFFLITAYSYSFFKILNVGILTLAAFVGLRFLTGGMRTLNEQTAALAAARRREREEQARAEQAERERAEALALAELAAADQAAAAAADEADDDGPEAADLPKPVSAVPGLAAPVAPPAAGPNGTGVRPTATIAPVSAVPVSPVPQQATPVLPPYPMPAQPVLMPDGRLAYPVPGPAPRPMPRPAAQQELAPGERPASMALLNVWILLFGFVGTQLAWTLRPFFGEPHEKFEIFRAIEGNFYVNIVKAIGELFT